GEMEKQQTSLQVHVDEMVAKQSRIADHLSHFGEELTAARVALGQVEEKKLASEQHVDRHQSTIAEVQQQIERLIASAESV
ncbi:hypothetical protein, partial [Rhizobium leguminosarum]|uniref:hypothetical protein n=1 Tax=Rhizobium leguminosarum TaxID=384 RepID=UPI003F971228